MYDASSSPLLPLRKQSPYVAVTLPFDHSSVSSKATFMYPSKHVRRPVSRRVTFHPRTSPAMGLTMIVDSTSNPHFDPLPHDVFEKIAGRSRSWALGLRFWRCGIHAEDVGKDVKLIHGGAGAQGTWEIICKILSRNIPGRSRSRPTAKFIDRSRIHCRDQRQQARSLGQCDAQPYSLDLESRKRKRDRTTPDALLLLHL